MSKDTDSSTSSASPTTRRRHGPAFQFYAGDALSDEGWIRMSFEARGVFITLLCHQWIEGSIPAAELEIARLLHMDTRRFSRVWGEVLDKFELLREEVGEKSEGSRREVGETPNRLVNAKLAYMRANDAKYRGQQSEAGKKGNEARYGITDDEAPAKASAKGKKRDRTATATRAGSRSQSDRSSSSSSSSVRTPLPPKGGGVRSAPDPEPEPNPPDQPELRRVAVVFSAAGWTRPHWEVDGRIAAFIAAGGKKADAQTLLAASGDKDSPGAWLWTVLSSESSWRSVVCGHADKLRTQQAAADANHDKDFGDGCLGRPIVTGNPGGPGADRHRTEFMEGADKPDKDVEGLLG